MHVLFCLLGLSQVPLAGRPMILDCAPESAASEFVFVTAPTGIWQFDRRAANWKHRRTPGDWVRYIGVKDDTLWVITPKGAASAGVHGGGWRLHRIPGQVRCLAFAGGRVWAGGDSGLLGFDPKTRSWWQRAEFVVNELLYWKDCLWIASNAGAFRYDLKTDLIRELPTRQGAYGRVFPTVSRVWFVSDQSIAVHHPDTDSTAVFTGVPVKGCSSVGDSLFIVSRGGVFLYEPGAGKWVEVADTMPLRGIEAVSVEDGSAWFADMFGLRRYSLSDTARQDWSRALNRADPPQALHADQRFVYMVGARQVQVLDRQQDAWTVVSLAAPRRFFDFLRPRR